MAVRTLNPTTIGNYTDYNVTPPAGGGYSGDPVEYLSDTQHGTNVTPNNVGASTTHLSFKFDEIPADVPGTTPVAEVRLFIEGVVPGGGQVPAGPHTQIYALSRHGGVNGFSTDLCPVGDAGPGGMGPSAIEEWVFPERPETGPWTVADFQGGSRVEFGVKTVVDAAGGVASYAKLWVKVTYQAVVPSYDAGREVAGRMLRMRRRLIRTYTVDAPLWVAMDAELGDDVLVDYFAAEDPTGQGWLYKLWQRGWLKIVAITPEATLAKLKLLWLREWAVLWWDTMASESAAGIYGQGVARYSLGEKRTFVRASAAWIGSVVSGPVTPSKQAKNALYYLAVDNVEKVTSGGTIFMSARTNKQLHSSFIQGITPAATGWTFEGTGGANTIAAEVPASGLVPLFESSVGARRLKIAAGGTLGADLDARSSNTASITANADVLVTLGHLDADASKPLKVAVKRVVSAVTTWWRNSDSTWQASKTWNTLTGTSTAVGVETLNRMAFGGTAGTLEIQFGFANGDTARTGYAYHAEIVEAKYRSQELIVTTTVAYTVAADNLSVENNSGTPSEVRRWLPSSAFVVTWQGVTFWAPADLAAGEKRVMLSAEFDASNSIKVLYDKDNARIEAQHKRAGTTVTAFKAATPSPGQRYTFALRVIGSTGEQDMTPYTVSVFVDRVKGTDAVPAGVISMPSTSSVYIGRESGGNVWDGLILNFEVTHEVLSDLEISGKP